MPEPTDYTSELDAQIAEARRQWAEVEQKAKDGDKIAQLLVKRMEAAKRDLLASYATNLFG